jgi:hypothetical protein
MQLTPYNMRCLLRPQVNAVYVFEIPSKQALRMKPKVKVSYILFVVTLFLNAEVVR